MKTIAIATIARQPPKRIVSSSQNGILPEGWRSALELAGEGLVPEELDLLDDLGVGAAGVAGSTIEASTGWDVPADALPADALPADALPADALPADALPADEGPLGERGAFGADAVTGTSGSVEAMGMVIRALHCGHVVSRPALASKALNSRPQVQSNRMAIQRSLVQR
jgi:hypothetical protein